MNQSQRIEQGFESLAKKAEDIRFALSYIHMVVKEGYMSEEDAKRLEDLPWWEMVEEVKELGEKGDFYANL